MKKFNQITILEKIVTSKQLIHNLSKYSKKKVKYYNTPVINDNEIIKRIGNSDCLLVTWSSKISKKVIEKTNLKFIGLCASLYKGKNSNIDLESVKAKGIVVRGISDYGDYGTVEYIISETINYFKNNNNRELKGKDIGIIGLGNVGKKVFKALNFFDTNVYYFNNSRKLELEKQGIVYLSKQSLLKKVEVLILCVPRNSEALIKQDFNKLRANFLINISMGIPFNINNFNTWIKKKGKFASFDQVGVGKVRSRNNIIIKNYVSGFTEEAKIRQVTKVEENIIQYLNK